RLREHQLAARLSVAVRAAGTRLRPLPAHRRRPASQRAPAAVRAGAARTGLAELLVYEHPEPDRLDHEEHRGGRGWPCAVRRAVVVVRVLREVAPRGARLPEPHRERAVLTRLPGVVE